MKTKCFSSITQGITQVLHSRTLSFILLSLSLLLGMSISHSEQMDNTILIFSPRGNNFQDTIKGLSDDLAGDAIIITKWMNNTTENDSIAQSIKKINPRLLVFLGNTPLQAYTRYQKQQTNNNFTPAIALATLHLDRQLKYLKNTIGIRYEIPAVTSLVQLRTIVKAPIKRVGVIYRQWMNDFIAQNKAYCKQEDIELIAIKMPNSTSINKLSYQLKHLLHKNIDALWVVNDNGLLHARFIQNVWVPLLKNFNKPVVVGIQKLTKTNLNFGIFSVEADHYALGVQGAEMIAEIMANGWKIDTHKVEPPVSINNILNVKLSNKKNILLNQQKLEQLDTLIQ